METLRDPVLRLLTIIIVLDFISLGQLRRMAWLVGIKSAPYKTNKTPCVTHWWESWREKLLAEQPFQELWKVEPNKGYYNDSQFRCNPLLCLRLSPLAQEGDNSCMKFGAFPNTLWHTSSSENFYLPVEFCVSDESGVYQATNVFALLELLNFLPPQGAQL